MSTGQFGRKRMRTLRRDNLATNKAYLGAVTSGAEVVPPPGVDLVASRAMRFAGGAVDVVVGVPVTACFVTNLSTVEDATGAMVTTAINPAAAACCHWKRRASQQARNHNRAWATMIFGLKSISWNGIRH